MVNFVKLLDYFQWEKHKQRKLNYGFVLITRLELTEDIKQANREFDIPINVLVSCPAGSFG